MKKLLLGTAMVVMVLAVALAIGNRDRVVELETLGDNNNIEMIGRCDPETDGSAEGWDQTPTSGNWGGVDESLFAVAWEPDSLDKPKAVGRMAKCTIAGRNGVRPQRIDILALDGLGNDDYCVFASTGAGDVLVGCTDPEPGGENWVLSDFFLDSPPLNNAFAKGQDTTITILVTGDGWSGRTTYGQVAVDYIEVWGD